jgi:hypothetical protein
VYEIMRLFLIMQNGPNQACASGFVYMGWPNDIAKSHEIEVRLLCRLNVMMHKASH